MVSPDQTAAAHCLTDHNDVKDIIIYYDMQKNRKDCIGSLYHELVHVLLDGMKKHVKKRSEESFYETEENIVQCLEQIFIQYCKFIGDK